MVMEIVADSERRTALDIVEVNPTLDPADATAQLGAGTRTVGSWEEDSQRTKRSFDLRRAL